MVLNRDSRSTPVPGAAAPAALLAVAAPAAPAARAGSAGPAARGAAAGSPAPALLPAALSLAVLLALAAPGPAAAQPAAADEEPRPGEVSLPLKDYLALAESAERAEQARAAAKLHQEAPLAEVVAQRTTVEIDGIDGSDEIGGSEAIDGSEAAGTAAGRAAAAGEGEARLVSDLEVLVQGHPRSRLALPLAGVAVAVEVRAAAVTAAGGATKPHAAAAAPAAAAAMVDGGAAATPGLYLLAAEPGRYTVHARSRERFAGVQGESRVTLAPIVAPVAVLEIGLPAGLAWECAGAVVVEDRVEGRRRHLRLSAGRGLEPVLALRRRVAGDEAAALLAQDDVVTLLQLRPEGLRRHDVVLYEVTRGGLDDLVVDLPPGFEVERAGTDEGEAQPVVEGNRIVVHRRRRLQGSGFLVLTTRPAVAAGLLPLGLITPRPPPRARFLAAAATVPGSMAPQPAASWTRVDLGDLPRTLGDTLAQLDVTAAWRHGERSAGGASPADTVRVITAPQAAALETVVRRRLTTTLLTVDGTLLHLDRFELAQAGEALYLALPPGATLWSASADGKPVRPLVLGVGKNGAVKGDAGKDGAGSGGAGTGEVSKGDAGTSLAVPLGAGGARLVEVAAVVGKVIAKGRSQLAFELARVQAPVLEHRWRLLLPENARYRFRAADLRPVPEPTAPRAAAAPGSQAAAGSRQASGVPGGVPTANDPWEVLQAHPGVLADRTNVGGNESGRQSTYLGPAASGLHGRVTDQTGAALPGATVTVTTSGQAPPSVQLTNAKGDFGFVGLPAGTYELKAELPGFSPVAVPGIRVTAAERGTEADLALSSAVEDVITVTSEASILDERAIRTGAVISQKELRRDPSAVLNDLRQGLVGGVRPLPVDVPQTGKTLLLAGVLPPARVAVELEVRSGAR
jgi:Carboxypeptidase regulatory-like domain